MLYDVKQKQEKLSSIVPWLQSLIDNDMVDQGVFFIQLKDGMVLSRTFATNTPITLMGAIEIWKVANYLGVQNNMVPEPPSPKKPEGEPHGS